MLIEKTFVDLIQKQTRVIYENQVLLLYSPFIYILQT